MSDDFSPDKIADSGQCFRWTKQDLNTYRIIAGSACLYLTSLGGDDYELSCTEEDFQDFWRPYFDLDLSYREIRARIDRQSDPFLFEASEKEQGIRILRQDPWEMLITFIISQNRNIPSIRRSVEFLAERCGERKIDARGEAYHAFPTPQAVAALPEESLEACRLGYRCKYVRAAAKTIASGVIDLTSLQKADEETAIAALTGLYGVGVKVANCVALFGLHHLDAFPIDVWVRRILENEYPSGYPRASYSPYNGIYQQYMFACYRHMNS